MDDRPRIAILISGRGSNMEAILAQARSGRLADACEVAVVFSNRPDAPGLERARTMGFETRSLASRGKDRETFDREMLALLEPYRLDFLVLAGFMRVLSGAVVRRYPMRIVNIHPADTRAHKGLHGYRWAFENRLETTWITVHVVDEGLDTGPVLARREVDLRGAGSEAEVERRGLAVEHAFYSEVLRELFVDSRRGRPAPEQSPGAGGTF